MTRLFRSAVQPGVPYRDLYKQNLWEPAGMPHTTFSPTDVIRRGNYANGYYDEAESDRAYNLGPLDNDLWAAAPSSRCGCATATPSASAG